MTNTTHVLDGKDSNPQRTGTFRLLPLAHVAGVTHF
jgi:hypothetical protein